MAKPPPPPAKTSNGVVDIQPGASTKKGTAPKPTAVVDNLKRPQDGALKPLNFKVSPDFHREFKTYAATHGISMVDLLREGFALVKEHRGKN
ncbi:hypothetical protein SAMN05421693_13221 [Ectothiorhodospira magna]|uniref:ParG protein n=2 Tax=Ectothiorhodospira magna TaxID=867345 RepID=A0A1H9G474_9GAMM|nr:hypothetical protein SAMN05421693_13221 [Ectothiorhodospira magna]